MAARSDKPIGSLMVEGDLRVNVFKEDQAFEVWLDQAGRSRSGLVIGIGKTEETAVSDARKTLLRALAETEGWNGRT